MSESTGKEHTNKADDSELCYEVIDTKPKWLKITLQIFIVLNPIMVLFTHFCIAVPFIIIVQFFILLLLYAVNLEKMTEDVKKIFRIYSGELFVLTIFIHWLV